jgi:transcription initiation factor IIE alpha subunit
VIADPQRLSSALARAFEMEPEDARELADVVLERFSDKEEVDDETLDAEVRSVFYTLEAKRMLSFRRVEYVREDGDRRRAFYWKLRDEALDEGRSIPIQVEDVDVYATLPATAWRHAG